MQTRRMALLCRHCGTEPMAANRNISRSACSRALATRVMKVAGFSRRGNPSAGLRPALGLRERPRRYLQLRVLADIVDRIAWKAMQPIDDVVEHYERTREADRLFSGPGQLERVRTQEIITRHLLPPPAQILDVGGGPGVYARWLLHEGYEVDLVDPVGSHVEAATRTFREERLPGRALRGDARRLDAEIASYDAVLLLGPLYHLPERCDRIQALLEVGRVLRPGGIAFLAAISRFASLLDGFARGFVRDPEFLRILTRDLSDGQHRNAANTDYFTTSFFHKPEEFEAEIREAGFELQLLAGVEGPFWCINSFPELWDDASMRGLLLDFARQAESEPSLLGASAHWLAVVRTPA